MYTYLRNNNVSVALQEKKKLFHDFNEEKLVLFNIQFIVVACTYDSSNY